MTKLAELGKRVEALEALVSEGCAKGIAERIGKIETDVDATAEMVEEYLLKKRLEPRPKRRWFTNFCLPKVLCGSPDKPMRIPTLGIEIPCYVIEGERRVFVQRGMVDALGMARGGVRGGGDRLANFVQGERIKPFFPNELEPAIIEPIKFVTPYKAIAYGYDAEVLHAICLAMLEARRNGKLQKQQLHIAERCELLIGAWSLAGIISAVDEASGWDVLHGQYETRRINHSFAFSDDDACTNQAESYFSRLRRAEIGQHHRVGVHLACYAGEMAWRENNRRKPNGTLFQLVAASAAASAPSRQWKGYWQGRT